MKWVDKYKRYFYLTECDWGKIWQAVHDTTHSYKIQSCIWEILHLNYYCSFRAHRYYNEDNRCKLCMEVEDDIFHIILSCPVSKEIFSKFNATFKEIDGKDITNREIAFGNQESGGKII